jgi:hypothetical protein
MTQEDEVELAAISAIIDPLFKVSSFCWQECTRLEQCCKTLDYLIGREDFSNQYDVLRRVQKQVLREWNKVIAYWGLIQEQLRPGLARLNALSARVAGRSTEAQH